MNDLGANVAAILDDNQMGYADMDDYVDLARTERFIKAKERGEYDLSEVLTRAADDVGFEEVWGEGIKMNWQPVAKEDQKCHINWRQSINDDGSNLQRLASFPKDEIESGSILTAATNSSQSTIDKEYQAMQSNSREDLKKLLQIATQSAQNADEAISAIKSGIIDQARQAVGSQSIDTLVVACIHFITKMNIAEVVKKYADMLGGLGVKNVGLIVSGIGCGNNAIRGEGEKFISLKRLVNAQLLQAAAITAVILLRPRTTMQMQRICRSWMLLRWRNGSGWNMPRRLSTMQKRTASLKKMPRCSLALYISTSHWRNISVEAVTIQQITHSRIQKKILSHAMASNTLARMVSLDLLISIAVSTWQQAQAISYRSMQFIQAQLQLLEMAGAVLVMPLILRMVMERMHVICTAVK